MTADEVLMAGGANDNDTYYLQIRQDYWLGSPGYFNTDHINIFFQSNFGGYANYQANIECGVRPVISLSSKVKLSGSGTYNDVYTVS